MDKHLFMSRLLTWHLFKASHSKIEEHLCLFPWFGGLNTWTQINFFLDFCKFATWTHVEEGLPEYFQNGDLDMEAKSILAEVGKVILKTYLIYA